MINNMKFAKRKLIGVICILLLVVICFYFLFTTTKKSPTQVTTPTSNQTQIESQTSPVSTNEISIYEPLPGDVLSSGVVELSGQAKGNWYFEATAPVEIEDSNKNIIASGNIIAQGDWTTNNFVPFKGEISFTIPAGMKNGFVVFKNDNPSGDSSKAKEVSVPVVFQ